MKTTAVRSFRAAAVVFVVQRGRNMREEVRGFSGFALKIIAVVTMTVDHAGKVFFPEYMWMTMIGRLAFPLFCFLLTEGFIHTGNVRKYLARLFVFALISEIPFDWALHGRIFYWDAQNVFFTLFLGLAMLYLIQRYSTRQAVQIGVFLAAVVLAVFFRTDYSGLGICFIFIFYQFYYRKWLKFGLFTAVSLIVYLQAPQDYTSILAVLPMIFYNGKRGIPCKYFFYIFYPAHLAVLVLLRICL